MLQFSDLSNSTNYPLGWTQNTSNGQPIDGTLALAHMAANSQTAKAMLRGINYGVQAVKQRFKYPESINLDLQNLIVDKKGFAITDQVSDEMSGSSVSTAGDVNGDGLSDVIVGTPWGGNSYVVFGKTTQTPVDLNDIAKGIGGGFAITSQDSLLLDSGHSVSDAGDVNNDGLSDVIIGGPRFYQGLSYVVFGKITYTTVDLNNVFKGVGGFAITSESKGVDSGWSVSKAGDVNGDGFSDVIVGAPYNGAAGTSAGRSYVVFGKSNLSRIDLSDVVKGSGGFAITGQAIGDYSGFSVSTAGDVNGDGLSDVIVGAPNNNATGVVAGRSYVIFGKSTGGEVKLNDIANGIGDGFAITEEGDDRYSYSGGSVSVAGDVNGDGLSDVIVGVAGIVTQMATQPLRAYVIFGKADKKEVNLKEIVNGKGGFVITDSYSGFSRFSYVNPAGDMNGDGLADITISTPYWGDGYVVFGKSNGRAVELQRMSAEEGFVLSVLGNNMWNRIGNIKWAGDVDKDGAADLILSAPDARGYAGCSYVLFGGQFMINSTLTPTFSHSPTITRTFTPSRTASHSSSLTQPRTRTTTSSSTPSASFTPSSQATGTLSASPAASQSSTLTSPDINTPTPSNSPSDSATSSLVKTNILSPSSTASPSSLTSTTYPSNNPPPTASPAVLPIPTASDSQTGSFSLQPKLEPSALENQSWWQPWKIIVIAATGALLAGGLSFLSALGVSRNRKRKRSGTGSQTTVSSIFESAQNELQPSVFQTSENVGKEMQITGTALTRVQPEQPLAAPPGTEEIAIEMPQSISIKKPGNDQPASSLLQSPPRSPKHKEKTKSFSPSHA